VSFKGEAAVGFLKENVNQFIDNVTRLAIAAEKDSVPFSGLYNILKIL